MKIDPQDQKNESNTDSASELTAAYDQGANGGASSAPADSDALLNGSQAEVIRAAAQAEDEVPVRRIRNGDIEVAYWSYGEGKPLMLVTGVGMAASSWGPLPSALARRGYQAIVMDNRDCGMSSVCEGDYTITDMAEDAALVLDDLGVSRTYLLGISMGGFIAQELALNHPDRVERLMLLATGPGIGGGVPPETELMDAIFNSPPDEESREATTRIISLLAGPGWAENNRRLVRFAVSRMPSDISEMGRHWIASASFSSWDRLDQLKCPVLIAHGTADRLIPPGNGEALASKLSQAEFIKLEGAGHLLPLERPRELMEAISRFFPLPSGLTSDAPDKGAITRSR